MSQVEHTLAELAEASGLQPRTIRSWVAQDLLPAPLSRGPAARYPADTLERLLAVRAMRERLGMPLVAIRQEMLVASTEQIRAYAAMSMGLAPENLEPTGQAASSALDYLRGLRERTEAKPPSAAPMPAAGFEALVHRLADGRAEPVRKTRAEEWLRIPVTPDVELAVRGHLDAEQRTRLERCADLIRDILLGRDR